MRATWKVIVLCPDCDDQGLLPDRSECTHQPVYIAAAARGAEKARKSIRPTVNYYSIGNPQTPTEPHEPGDPA